MYLYIGDKFLLENKFLLVQPNFRTHLIKNKIVEAFIPNLIKLNRHFFIFPHVSKHKFILGFIGVLK